MLVAVDCLHAELIYVSKWSVDQLTSRFVSHLVTLDSKDKLTLMWSADLIRMTHKWAYQGAAHRLRQLYNEPRFDSVP